MKQYIKNIMILILALPWGLLLTNCSDSESDYSDDNAYPPPTVELTSPSEIDVVEPEVFQLWVYIAYMLPC